MELFNQTGKLLTNLIPGTTYEYRVKAMVLLYNWIVNMVSIQTFATLSECPKMLVILLSAHLQLLERNLLGMIVMVRIVCTY